MFGIFKKKENEEELFLKDNGIKFRFDELVICNGLFINEFNHHLRYYSNNTVSDFSDLENLMNNKDTIIATVITAIENDQVAEKGMIDDGIARTNAVNFLNIMKKFTEYHKKFNPKYSG